jgi:hypothetical protein
MAWCPLGGWGRSGSGPAVALALVPTACSFGRGLTEAFSFAAGACVLGAVASLRRGGKYHHVEAGTVTEGRDEPIAVPAQEAVAETEPLLVD